MSQNMLMVNIKERLFCKESKVGFIILTAFTLPMPYWVVELSYPITPGNARDVGMYNFFVSGWHSYHFWMHLTMLLVLINLIYLGTILVNE